RLPEEVRPKMEAWYAKRPDAPLQVRELVDIRKAKIGDAYYVFVALRVGPEYALRYYAVEEIEQEDGNMTYLLDWETSTGYQPIDIYDYKIQQPRTPVQFRVNAVPHQYYNHAFADESEWLAFKLT